MEWEADPWYIRYALDCLLLSIAACLLFAMLLLPEHQWAFELAAMCAISAWLGILAAHPRERR